MFILSQLTTPAHCRRSKRSDARNVSGSGSWTHAAPARSRGGWGPQRRSPLGRPRRKPLLQAQRFKKQQNPFKNDDLQGIQQETATLPLLAFVRERHPPAPSPFHVPARTRDSNPATRTHIGVLTPTRLLQTPGGVPPASMRGAKVTLGEGDPR